MFGATENFEQMIYLMDIYDKVHLAKKFNKPLNWDNNVKVLFFMGYVFNQLLGIN